MFGAFNEELMRKVEISPEKSTLSLDFSLSPRINGPNWLKKTDRGNF
jgi:hypothetical protein